MKIILLLLIIILIGCTDKSEPQLESHAKVYTTKDTRLSKVRDFVLKVADSEIGRIEPPILISEDEGKLFYYDLGLSQIIVSDTLGNIISKFGRKGRGPKEFLHITSYGIDKDTIYVYDGNLGKFKKFTLNGELLDIFDGPIKDNLWFRSNRIYVDENKLFFGIQEAKYSSASNHWKSRTVAEYTKDGKFISLFGDYDPDLEGSSRLYKYANMVYDNADNFMYTVHRTSKDIQKYNLNTKEIISRFSNPQSTNFLVADRAPDEYDSRVDRNRLNLSQSFVGDPFVSEDYFVFYFFNFTEEYWETRDQSTKHHFLQFFDKQDNFLFELEVPYYPLGMAGNNLLLVENDNPDNFRIGVYNIQ